MAPPHPEEKTGDDSIAADRAETKRRRLLYGPDPARDDYTNWKNQDVVMLGREGGCSKFCEVAFARLGRRGTPHGLRGPEGIAHYFLMFGEQALDVGGVMSSEEMKNVMTDSHEVEYDVVVLNWSAIHRNIATMLDGDLEVHRILRRRFNAHIDQHEADWKRLLGIIT